MPRVERAHASAPHEVLRALRRRRRDRGQDLHPVAVARLCHPFAYRQARHFHLLALDGVYFEEDSALRFVLAPLRDAVAPRLTSGYASFVTNALVDRAQRIHAALRVGLVERDEALWLGLLAALSGEHYLLVGPPGTAKSSLARRIHTAFPGRYFERLLTRFTVPEELFGPLSLKGLERDVYERLGDGYLPTATIAFLDEIFKANSAILNALLGILNERAIDQGPRRDLVPLVSLIGASNELPSSEELAALSDRFLLRFVVGPVSSEHFGALLDAQDAPPSLSDDLTLSAADLASLRASARAVHVPSWVKDVLGLLRARLAEQVYVSDRRWRRALDVLRMAALLEGREAVGLTELGLLVHVLWQRVEQRPLVETALRRVMVDAFLAEPERYAVLVGALEKTLEEERAAEHHVTAQRGPLYLDADGSDTLVPSSRRQKRNSTGELLFRAPPGSDRYACTAEQLRERFTSTEAAAWIRDRDNWLVGEVPNKLKLAPRTYPEEHLSARRVQVTRLRAHLREFLRMIDEVVAGESGSAGIGGEIATVRKKVAELDARLDALAEGFQSLPTFVEAPQGA